MATILFAWELGANLGHLIPISRIARQLDSDGHHSVFALRDLAYARSVLGARAAVLQAPLWPDHRHFGAISGVLSSYADILAAIGFAEPDKIAAAAGAWNTLVELVKPDVIVADHSPGLLVATHGSDIKVVAIGTGFTMPPLDYDRFPPLRGDAAPVIPEARLFESVRDARALIGRKRPATFIDVFRTEHRVVFGLPELDPYHSFRREPLAAAPGGFPPAQPWPRNRRLFVYAGSDMQNFDLLVQALAASEIPLEVYLREAGPAGEFLRMRGAVVHDTPPPLGEVFASASHFLGEGGAGSSAAAYSAGRPQLIVAAHAEAMINLEFLQRAGVGRGLEIIGRPAEIAAAIKDFVDDRVLPDNALEAANRIARRILPDGAEVTAQMIRSAIHHQSRPALGASDTAEIGPFDDRGSDRSPNAGE